MVPVDRGAPTRCPSPLRIARVRFVLELLVTLVIALALGLASAWYMVDAPRIGIGVGAWKAIPAISSEIADPYSRARIARTGEIALGAGEGIVFVAEEDDQGGGLDGGCEYTVSGETPTARLWTLTAIDGEGRLAAAITGRVSLTSREILRDLDGRFTVAVSATGRPGNWLPTNREGRFRLVMRLYDTPLALSPGNGMVMPRIERGSCR